MKILCLAAILAVSASAGLAQRLVCYYTNWSRYGEQPFNIESINASLCTHIVYAFLGLDEAGAITSLDKWNDFGDEWTEGGIKRFVRLKNQNPSVKLLIGVGGWGLGPAPFQSMVRDPEKRKTFMLSTLGFIDFYGFDGLEIDWIYHSDGGSEADKQGLSQLIKEMKPRYEDRKRLLSVATSANPRIFDKSYDIATLTKLVAYVQVMSYDLHGSWDGKTGHVAPLRGIKGETPEWQELNVEAVINKYIKRGAIPEKLNLGVVTYGRTFTLTEPHNNGLNAPTRGPGKIEPLPYRTFCVQDAQGLWTKHWVEEQSVPYAVSGNQWVGYEDPKSLKAKINFSKAKKLGGISYWSFDGDDFQGVCGFGRFPLLMAIRKELLRK